LLQNNLSIKSFQKRLNKSRKRLRKQIEREQKTNKDRHPTQATKVSCGWIKKGHDKAIENTGSRTKLSLVGAIDWNDLAVVQVRRYDKVNSETIQRFFTKLRDHSRSDKRIHVILDAAGYHRSHDVKDKVDELNIELHYLPPYSPNLNPIERLWKVMNEHVRNHKDFATAKKFRDKIDEFFNETLTTIGDILETRINDNTQVLKPAS
jgi:transposase